MPYFHLKYQRPTDKYPLWMATRARSLMVALERGEEYAREIRAPLLQIEELTDGRWPGVLRWGLIALPGGAPC